MSLALAPTELSAMLPAHPRTRVEMRIEPVASRPGWQLFDETTVTSAIVDAVAGARHVVNAEFFGITDAGKGARLTTALEQAARRGVEVNVIADFVSRLSLPLGSFQRMRSRIEDAGGRVVVTSRLPGSRRAAATPALAHVDHRKVVTVDGKVGFLGGMNFVPLKDGYRDTMVRLEGVGAARLGAEQLDRWQRVGGDVSPRHRASVADALGDASRRPTDPRELDVLANAPEQRRFELSDAYRELIRGAKQRLWISSPGFADREVLADIRAAAERGVDVRIVAPGKPPVGIPFFSWVGRAHLGRIVEAGGRAVEIPDVLHRKALVADDEAVLSSYNLTERSRLHDHELGIRTKDPQLVTAIAEVLGADMASGSPLDPASLGGVAGRIGAFVATHFSY